MRKNPTAKDCSELIVEAIQKEPYFTKEVLVPKIKSLITAFRLRLSTSNYEKILNPTETAKLIRANELHNLEKDFWKTELKEIVGQDNMEKYYLKLDEKRLLWN